MHRTGGKKTITAMNRSISIAFQCPFGTEHWYSLSEIMERYIPVSVLKHYGKILLCSLYRQYVKVVHSYYS